MLVLNLVISLSGFINPNSLTQISSRRIKQIEVLLFEGKKKGIFYMKSLIFQKKCFNDGRISRGGKHFLIQPRNKDHSA